MKKLINSLDKKALINQKIKNNNIFNKEKKNSYKFLKEINLINKNYYLNKCQIISSDLKNELNFILQKKNKIIPEKKFIKINKNISNLEDLINISMDLHINNEIEYNLDLIKLKEIIPDLILLKNMIGINFIKENILNQILFYLQKFHLKTKITYMHTVIYGPPGTGKTEIAKIIGSIFSKLGVLNKKTFKKVVRSDLIAGYLGQTAIKTKKVVEDSIGGVLFIDEAYSLGNDNEKQDSFAKECLDTLCEALSYHRNELMVIIAGYEKEINKYFFGGNPGLKSRFTWVYYTDESSPSQLKAILIKMINEINWTYDNNSISLEFFEKNMKFFENFGRDMELLLLKITICHSKRVLLLDENFKTHIVLQDLLEGFELFKKNINIKNDNNTSFNLMYM